MKKTRMIVNVGMTIVLLGLMSYSLIGETTHEILGTIMVVLFIVHHILNRKWFGALNKGRYSAFRICQTILVFLMLVSVVMSAVSGIIISKHLYVFLGFSQGMATARSIHIVCAYANSIPMPVATFLEQNNFEGKTVYLIATQGSSGYGNTVGEIEKAAKGAKVEPLTSIYCEDIPNARQILLDIFNNIGDNAASR